MQALYSMSVTLMRSDAAWEAYYAEMTKVIKSGRPDAELIVEISRQVVHVENSAFTRASGHLSVSMALLYVTVEGWRKWEFGDAEVDLLIASPFMDELRKFRHAIFHANAFNDRAVLQFMETPAKSQWVTQLSNALRAALRNLHAYVQDRAGRNQDASSDPLPNER